MLVSFFLALYAFQVNAENAPWVDVETAIEGVSRRVSEDDGSMGMYVSMIYEN